MVKTKPLISVVIPTLNEEKYISHLLQDLAKQTLRPNEVLIVDGHSSDLTVTLARKFKGVLVFKKNPSTAIQRNLGAQKSKGEIIFFIDADVRLDQDFLQNAVNKYRQSGLDIACPFFLPYRSSIAIFLVFCIFDFIFFILQKFLPSGAGTCLIVKSSIFRNNLGFDPEFKFEDMEYIRRIGRKNKFGIINEYVNVSDRRFKKNGFFITTFKYFLLSLLFAFGLFRISNMIEYRFGGYNEK